MKGQRIMKIVGLLVVIAAVVMVVLYFTGVLGPKKAPATPPILGPGGKRDVFPVGITPSH